MALPRPQWVVVGPSADERYKLCDALALRYGIVHVAESVASSSADESNGADVVLRRLHDTDCAAQGWVLNSVPSTIEECNAFIAGGIVPRIVFDLFEDDASSTLRSLVDAALQVWKSASDTTTTIKCAISSPDSSETVATSIYRAIDTRTWTLHLQSEVPSLADEHPEAVADLVHVTATLPLTEQAAAMKLLSSLLTFKGMGALAPDCGSSVVSLVKVYTGVTKATQATVASRFPPEILAMLPFVETLSPNALMTMAPLAQEIFIDASSAGAIQPATAVKVHTAFFEVLSEKERRQLVRMLPAKEQELVTHVVETTEGLSPRGVETVVHMLLQSTNHSLPSQPSKNHSPPQPFVVPGPNETSVHQPLADHTYGAIDIPDAPPPPSRDAVMAKLALTATKAHGRRLMRWVRSAPRSLRVLSFVSSVLLFVTACISMVLDVVAGPMIVVVINMWIVVFSLIMVSVEVKITAIEKHNSIATYFPLVRTVTGRGAFLLFISLIAMTLAVKATWQNAVLGVAGVVAAGISLWSIALGSIASHQFNALRSRIESLAQLKQAFDLADVDRAGELDVDGLGRFCLVWDWPIDVYFLEAIVRDLDGHNSNAVSLSDLQVWWSRAHHDTTMPPLQQSPRLSRCHRPTSIVKLFSIFTGVLTMVTGLVGNIASFHPRTVTTSEVAMYMMLDLWVILFGMIVVVVDAPPTWSHALNGCKRIVLDNFASFLATPVGRSFFCLFLSTFVVSVYQNDSVYLPMVTSACLALVSLVYTCVGRSAKRQFFLLAKAVDGTNCSRVFAAADNDGDGVWSLDELDAFCRAQHVVLSAAQWEVLVADLDQHHVGAITLHDFTTWVQLQHRNMS